MSERVWSHYQNDIFDEVAKGEGHLVVIARAGSGKTSTIIEAINRIPLGKRILLCAFNKSISEALEARIKASPNVHRMNVNVKTLHQLGNGALIRAWLGTPEKIKPSPNDQAAERRIFGEVFKEVRGITLTERQDLRKILRFAKANLATTVQDILAILDEQDCRPSTSAFTIYDYVEWTLKALEVSRKPHADISFDDMIYVPAYHGWKNSQYDVVFIDETQDMNKAQLVLACNALRPGGRIIAVGDDRQGIYAFRGADAQAIPRLIKDLKARVLPLSVTYRCPRAVVEVAQRYVPDIEPAPEAINGLVDHVTESQMKHLWAPGDFILSRINAPLVGLCMYALKNGQRARIQGRDIGAGLISLVKQSQQVYIGYFLEWLEQWRLEESLRLSQADKPDQVERVNDRAETLKGLGEGLRTTSELLDRISVLFSDDASEPDMMMFSSVHKAKGLESDRVWLLESTFRPKHSIEEENILYVAVTRAQRELYFVRLDKDQRRENLGEEAWGHG